MQRETPRVCFDTHILIWGIQGVSHADQKAMIGRTKRYIESLEEKVQIVVPAPALLEFLAGIPDEDHDRFCDVIEVAFRIGTLDAMAAKLAAKIQREAWARLKPKGQHRKEIKVDAQILAIAIREKCHRVITHDQKHFRELAKGQTIDIVDVPVIDIQKELFDDQH